MVDCIPYYLCSEIIKCSDQVHFKKAVIETPDGCIENPIRNNEQGFLPAELIDQIYEYFDAALLAWTKDVAKEYSCIAQNMPLPGYREGLTFSCEPLQLLKYNKTQSYNWHVDNAWDGWHFNLPSKTRTFSIVAYLNDDFSGGGTEFIDKKWTPEKGKALVFPSSWHFPHTACPVTEGTKYSIVTWYHPLLG